jgi:hypothetical protein
MSLPKNCIKISNSPNGKCRAIERKRLLIAEDLKQILIITSRRFFEPDSNDVDGIGEELTGRVDYPAYERNLIASNDKLCNPANGLMVSLSGETYIDAIGNVVASPIGLYDFFEPLLDQPVSIHQLVNQNILLEDQVYGTWNK